MDLRRVLLVGVLEVVGGSCGPWICVEKWDLVGKYYLVLDTR